MSQFDSLHSLKTYSRRKQIVIPSAKVFDDVVRRDHPSLAAFDCAEQMHLEFNVEKRKRRSEGECNDSKSESTPFLFGENLSERTQHDDKEACPDDKTQLDCDNGCSIQNSSFDLRRKTYVSLNPFSSKGLFVDEDSNIALQDEALQVHPVAFFDKVKSSGCKKSKMQLNIENSSYLQDNAVSAWKALKSASKDKLSGKKTSGKTNSLAFSKQTGIKPKRFQKVDSRQFTQDALLKCKAVESLNHSKHNSVKHLPVVSYYSSFKEAACHSGNLRKRKMTLDKQGQFLNSTFTGNSDTEGNAAEDANEIEYASSLNKNSCTVTKISSLKNSSALAPIDSVELDAKAKTFVDKFTQMFGTKLPFTSKSSSKTASHTSASLEVSEKSPMKLPVSKTLQVASADNTALLDFKMFQQFDKNNLSNSDLSPCFEDCNDTMSLVDDEVASCSVDEKAVKSLRIRRLFNGKTSSVGIPVASKDKANADAIFTQDSIRTDEDTDDDCSVLLLSPLPASPVEGPTYNLSTEKLQRRNDLSSISSRHSCNNRQIHGSPKAKDSDRPMTKGSDNGQNKSESKRRRAVDDDEGSEESDKVSSQANSFAENALNDKFQVCSEPSVISQSKFLKSVRSKLSFRSRSSHQKNAEHSLKVVKSDLSSVSEQQVKTEMNLEPPSDTKIALECGMKQGNNDLENYGNNFCRDESSRSSDQKDIYSEVNHSEGLSEQLLVGGENKCEWSVAKYHSRPSASVDVGSQYSFELCNRAYVAKEPLSSDDDNVCRWFRSRSSVKMVTSVSMNDSYKKAERKTEKCKQEEKSNSECIQVVENRSVRKRSKQEPVKSSPKLILNASSKSETDKTVVLNEGDIFAIPKELPQTTETPVTSTKPESRFRSKTEDGIAKELIGEQCSAPVHCTGGHQPRSNERRLLKSADKTSNKAKALYNPRQWHGSDEAEGCTETSTKPTKGHLTKAVSAPESYDFLTSDDLPPVMTRASSFPRQRQGSDVVKIRVAREDKPLFTVVRNVKEAHECQEYGETQEFHDDVDYILDGLQCSQPLATRCLSTLSLASKCLAPAFRMHLRAHGIIPKIFEALHDTSDSMPLSLCLSAMLFMMSCDRLTIELDDISLKLVLSLLDVDSECSDVVGGYEDFERTRLKVLELCRAVVNSSRISFLDLRLQDMTTKFLGIEVLLSLASKLTTDWFKRSLRAVGGLRHILDAVCQSAEEFERLSVELGDAHLCLCSRAMKCLKVLDNVTFLCPENQLFVVDYKSKAFMIACDRLLTSFIQHLTKLKQRSVASEETIGRDSHRLLLSSAALSILRVLLNVTHENEHGCRSVGQSKGLVLTVLTAIVHASDIASPCQQFDLSILGLSLLLNLTENCESNPAILCRLRVETPSADVAVEEKVTALESLSILFSQRYSAARLIEEVHDAKLEASEKRQQQQQQLFDGSSASGLTAAAGGGGGDASGHWVECESGLQWIDLVPPPPPPTLGPPSVGSDEAALSSQDDADNYTRDLHTAGRHMEDSIVAAYIALLIGSIVQGEKHLVEGFRGRLPEFSFIPLVRMLRKFLGFMNFANVSNASGNGSFHRILEILESL